MRVLGISGKRGSGKSLLADALQQSHGFVRLSLATPLKEMCKRDYHLTDDQVYGIFKEHPTQYKRTDGSFFTPRDILIREGCLKRSIDKDFWLKKLHLDIKFAMTKGHENFVIDDIRFLNEIAYLYVNFGAKFARIEREQKLNVFKAAMDDTSECELDTYRDWDFYLPSNKNRVPNDLKKFAKQIAKGF